MGDQNMSPSAGCRILSLFDAIESGDLASVRRCLEEGILANQQDENGNSALIHALFRRYWGIAEVLLAHHADVNIQDRKGWTPLFWAVVNGHSDIVAFLVKHRADPNIRTARGEIGLLLELHSSRHETN